MDNLERLTVSTEAAEITSIKVPKPIWRWDMFGDGYSMVITLSVERSWWVRMTTKFFFGSKWKRL